ncbi:hypothetical protein DL96DRAFT_1629710 [Flagelloscypha sp. PMI_526]|nr:hypothetical protein DL96DRAFT_1629710 [Flagelloscypha sp. PMI_526]
MSSTDEVKVPFFKRKAKSRPTTTRKRSASPPASSSFGLASSSKPQVVRPPPKSTGNLLSAGSKRTISQREALDAEDDPEAPLRDDGPDVKWSADNSHRNAALEILAGDEIEAVLAKRRRDEGLPEDEEAPDDGQYHGKSKYKAHLQKSKEVPKAMRVGPQRSATTIRQVTIMDYQPDVCKDYKETGYCGFGDTCKFLHDRGTYLSGWQIDKQWDSQQAARAAGGDNSDNSDSDSDDEDLPFACLICRKPYTDPVVTRCGHYFCSACAIKRFAKTPKCLACAAPTGGIFNRADKILEKLEKKKKKKEAGGSDDEDGEAGDVEIEGLGD